MRSGLASLGEQAGQVGDPLKKASVTSSQGIVPYNLQGLNPGVPTASFTVEVNGVAKAEGSDYSVSPTTGVIAFTIPPLSGQAVTASFWFYTSVRFSSDEYQMTLDSLYAKAQLELIEVFGE
ncbi:MAG TPA: DUF2460 domain-containing protein [Fimbriimonas sp.]|nr:DUF2460 domain-containing protein [Fimbriimonas sp.]